MSLVYVYGIVRAADALPAAAKDASSTRGSGGLGGIAEIGGIAGAPLRLVTAGPCAAVVTDVPESDFAEAALNARLGDLEWLGPRAVRHQEANAAVAGRASALVPLSFGTIFHDDAGVARMLTDERDDLLGRLDTLAGRDEWIAMLRRDLPVAEAALAADNASVAALRAEIAAAPPGRGYLLARRLGETMRTELRRQDGEAAARIVELLTGAGARLFREPLVENGGAGAIVRYSALVATPAADALAAVARDFAADWSPRGYALELSGPWPAYRFATLAPSATIAT